MPPADSSYPLLDLSGRTRGGSTHERAAGVGAVLSGGVLGVRQWPVIQPLLPR
jgi:hypothetical protein